MSSSLSTVYKNVFMIGDSGFDNLKWVDFQKKNSVEGHLLKKLKSCQIFNFAYDGFTTQSVLTGGIIGRVLYYNSKYVQPKLKDIDKSEIDYKGEVIDGGHRKIIPLKQLKETIANDAKNTFHYVVISVGGNDFRENLAAPFKLLWDVPKVQERYLKIVREVQSIQGKNVHPILFFQYLPNAKTDRPYHIYSILKGIAFLALAAHVASCGILCGSVALFMAKKVKKVHAIALGSIGALGLYFIRKLAPLSFSFIKNAACGKDLGVLMLGILLEVFYRPILEYAKKERIPIGDLPNLLNPFDETLYVSQIEPSVKGGERIAALIEKIVTEHHFSEESMIYTLNTAKKNIPHKWKVTYPKEQDESFL